DAVAAVHDRLHRTGQRTVALHDGVAVGPQHVAVSLVAPAHPGLDAVVLDHLPEALDRVAVDRLPGEHELQAVELGRIVRACDLHAAVHAERVGGEIQRRGWQLTDVEGHRAPVDQPFAGGAGQLGARRAVVTSDGDPGRAP